MHSQDFCAHLYADGFFVVISNPDLSFGLLKGTYSPATREIKGPGAIQAGKDQLGNEYHRFRASFYWLIDKNMWKSNI